MFISWNCGAPFCNFECLIQGNSHIFSRKCIFCLRIVWVLFSGFLCAVCWYLLRFSSVVSDSLRPHESQQARPLCPSPTPGVYSNSCRSSGDAIQPSCPLSSPFPPAPNPTQHQGLFQWVNSLPEVARVLEFQLQHSPSNKHPGLISFRMDWLYLLAVQGSLKSLLQHHSLSINFSALSLLHSPALTSIHDHWKNHSLD